VARNSERNSAELDGPGAQAGNRAASKQAGGAPGQGGRQATRLSVGPKP